MAIISIPEPLREKLGVEGAEALVHVLNENEKELRSSVLDFAGQRFQQSLNREISAVRVDLAGAEKRFEKHLSEEIASVRVDLAGAEKRFEKHLSEEIASVRVDLAGVEKRFEKHLSEEIASVRVDLAGAEKRFEKHLSEEIASVRGSIEKSRSDTIKWMFIFWIGQIGVLLGVLTAFFR